VLRVVAESLGPTADMVSVQSADAARRALLSNHFDLAVLDIAPTSGSGLDLLPDLRNRESDPIPLIVFSPKDVKPDYARPARALLTDSSAAIDGLVTMLRKRLRNHGVHRTEH
jgi:DNA-binding response OmpR family regulator